MKGWTFIQIEILPALHKFWQAERCSQMPCVDTDVRGKEQNKEEFSSLGFSAKGSNWKHSTSGALSVCLLKLELSAEKLWSVVSL